MDTVKTALTTSAIDLVRLTREGPQDEVLKNHSERVLIYDVLPPLLYE